MDLFKTMSDVGAIRDTGLQIWDDGVWIPIERETWRSWTGHRAVWGIPYHGPVYEMGSSEDAEPWDGPRVCSCQKCQEHVALDAKVN